MERDMFTHPRPWSLEIEASNALIFVDLNGTKVFDFISDDDDLTDRDLEVAEYILVAVNHSLSNDLEYRSADELRESLGLTPSNMEDRAEKERLAAEAAEAVKNYIPKEMPADEA
jgi:hypothetical protein